MNSKIISTAEVIEALVDGFEVLMIDKAKTNRYGVSCTPLTTQTFANIEKFVEEDNSNKIYIKTEKDEKKEEVENEK